MKKIKGRIDKKGVLHFELDGYHGQGCAAVTEEIVQKMGGKAEVEIKPEFNEPCQTTNERNLEH